MADAVLKALNQARADPPAYAETLRLYRTSIYDSVARVSGDPVGSVTREGGAPVDEAIAFLSSQAPLPPLQPSPILAVAAGDYAAQQGPAGAIGHVGADGLGPGERVLRRGGGRRVGEVIAYGFSDAASVVRQLIVDDGVPGRGHRAIIFDNRLRFIGVACGPHAAFGEMCVADITFTADGR